MCACALAQPEIKAIHHLNVTNQYQTLIWLSLCMKKKVEYLLCHSFHTQYDSLPVDMEDVET